MCRQVSWLAAQALPPAFPPRHGRVSGIQEEARRLQLRGQLRHWKLEASSPHSHFHLIAPESTTRDRHSRKRASIRGGRQRVLTSYPVSWSGIATARLRHKCSVRVQKSHARSTLISAPAAHPQQEEADATFMDHLWIFLAVLGAFLQAIRTAAQRDLNKHLSTLATTYVRSLFGLPVLTIYLLLVLAVTREGLPSFGWTYLAYTFAGAMAQVVATVLLIKMFTLRSFGVGTMLTKVDIVITAILGALFFSERLSAAGVIALAIVMAGVVMMSFERTQKVGWITAQPGSGWTGVLIAAVVDKANLVALGCATAFAISFLTFREAALVIGDGTFLWRGGWTVLLAILMQTVIVGAWLAWREPGLARKLTSHLRLSAFIGTTSAVGSICWFTAFALQNASYVRAVGQIEVVFTLLVSALYYRERISPLEYAGIALTVAGVLMFRLVY